MSYFLITLTRNQLQNFFFSSIWNLETVCWHLDTQWQVLSHNQSECLMQPIQMQLSQNQKIFAQFFSAFPESTKNLEYFQRKRWASEVICFWNYKQQKAGLLKCLKSPVSENLWTVNMLKGPKHCTNLYGSIFVTFLITLKQNRVEKLSFSRIWNLETVC